MIYITYQVRIFVIIQFESILFRRGKVIKVLFNVRHNTMYEGKLILVKKEYIIHLAHKSDELSKTLKGNLSRLNRRLGRQAAIKGVMFIYQQIDNYNSTNT